MADLRESLKDFIPKLLWEIINHPTGYVISNEEYNARWNLNVEQGDDTAKVLKDLITLLYDTILNDIDASPHLRLAVQEYVGTTLEQVLAEIKQDHIAVNNIASDAQQRVLVTEGTIQTHGQDIIDLDNFTATLQNQVNQEAAKLVTLQTELDALDSTFSTDAERVAAIVDVINQFQIADDDLEALIVNKADKSNVYTKQQIDDMTLGSYKMDIVERHYDVTAPVSSIPINVDGFNKDTDMLLVWQGGIFKTKNSEYFLLTSNEITFLSDLEVGTDVDWIVIRNIRVVTPEDQFEGSLIKPGTVDKTKLTTDLQAEINGAASQSDLTSLQSTVGSIQTSIAQAVKMVTLPGTFPSGANTTGEIMIALGTGIEIMEVFPMASTVGDWTITWNSGGFTINSTAVETSSVPYKVRYFQNLQS